MNIYVILAYFGFIADVLVCFSFYFYSFFYLLTVGLVW